jgi:CO dehydrogenase maturation factor
MKIAFVGKGGSGKTTLSASFSAYLEDKGERLLVVDADLNMHLAELLGFPALPVEKHISYPAAAEAIKTRLRGANSRIKSVAHFKKTTPPGKGSNLLHLDTENAVFDAYTLKRGDIRFMVVGTYSEEGIGASCYHNNLAILENILSHTIDDKGIVVTDMVAGTDAFASSLHAQFDLLVMVVEPTRRSLEVFDQYLALAEEAGVADILVAVGNKVKSDTDRAFIAERAQDKLLGFFNESKYIEEHDRLGGALDIAKLEPENKVLLETIYNKAKVSVQNPDARLKLLHKLHIRYVAQPFITERFGDLSDQIDPSFSYRQDTT